MRKFLESLHRNLGWAWTGLIVYAAAVTFPHEQVQLLVGAIANRLTRPGLYRLSAAVGIALAAVVTLILSRRLRTQPERLASRRFGILTLVLIFGTWGVFRATTRAGPLSAVFPGRRCAGGDDAVAGRIACLDRARRRSADQGYQYWALYPNRVSAFDYNDIYMDLLGGATGVLFAMAFLNCERRDGSAHIFNRAGVRALAGVIAIGTVLWATGKMALHQDNPHPHWFALSRQKTPFFSIVPALGPHHVHEATPLEGTLLIVLTIGVYAVLDRRIRIDVK